MVKNEFGAKDVQNREGKNEDDDDEDYGYEDNEEAEEEEEDENEEQQEQDMRDGQIAKLHPEYAAAVGVIK